MRVEVGDLREEAFGFGKRETRLSGRDKERDAGQP
jgi:hypothetical protein